MTNYKGLYYHNVIVEISEGGVEVWGEHEKNLGAHGTVS